MSVVPRARSAKSTIESWTYSRLSLPEPGRGNVAHPSLLVRPEPRTVIRPEVLLLRSDRAALPSFGHALRIGVVFLGARKEQLEIFARSVDLVRADQAVEQHPPVFAPGLDLSVSGQLRGQGSVLSTEMRAKGPCSSPGWRLFGRPRAGDDPVQHFSEQRRARQEGGMIAVDGHRAVCVLGHLPFAVGLKIRSSPHMMYVLGKTCQAGTRGGGAVNTEVGMGRSRAVAQSASSVEHLL